MFPAPQRIQNKQISLFWRKRSFHCSTIYVYTMNSNYIHRHYNETTFNLDDSKLTFPRHPPPQNPRLPLPIPRLQTRSLFNFLPIVASSFVHTSTSLVIRRYI